MKNPLIYASLLVLALLLNVNGQTPQPNLSKAATASSKTKAIHTITNTGIENCVDALTSLELAVHALADEDLCALKGILENASLSNQDKYDAMAGDPQLYALRNSADYYVGIMDANDYAEMPTNPVPAIAIDRYLHDWGIATVAIEDCIQWRIKRKECGQDLIFYSALCSWGGANNATVACLLACLWQNGRCLSDNDANYPNCAQGYLVNPKVGYNPCT